MSFLVLVFQTVPGFLEGVIAVFDYRVAQLK